MPAGQPLSFTETLGRWWRSRRVIVRDRSMEPTLVPGDRLRVDPGAYAAGAPRPGEIVVLIDPGAPDRWLVKRVELVDSGPPLRVTVRSDALGPTRDSRQFGPVNLGQVVGRVYRRYAPASRRSEL